MGEVVGGDVRGEMIGVVRVKKLRVEGEEKG